MCPVPQLEQKLPLCPRRSMHAHGTSPSPLARVAGIYRAAHQITIKTHPPPCSGIRNRARSYCLVGLVGPQHHHRGVLPWAVALSSSGKDVTQKRGEKLRRAVSDGSCPGLTGIRRDDANIRRRRRERESPSSPPRPAQDAPVDSGTRPPPLSKSRHYRSPKEMTEKIPPK